MNKNTDIKIDPEDYKFLEQNPYGDPDFSPEHNRRVIEEVDRFNDEMDKKRGRDYSEKTAERALDVARYLKNVSQGKGVSDIDRYFGKRHLAYLRGEQVVKELKGSPALVAKLKNRMKKRGRLRSL